MLENLTLITIKSQSQNLDEFIKMCKNLFGNKVVKNADIIKHCALKLIINNKQITFADFSGCATSHATNTTTSDFPELAMMPNIKTNLPSDIKLTKPNDKTIKINSTNTTICNIDLKTSFKEALSSKGYKISSDSKNTLSANVLRCEQNGEIKELLVDISFNEAQFLANGVLKDKNISLVEASALLEEELVFKVSEIF